MAAASPFTSTNVKEAWLIKGLRLLYSQKPEDGVRLRRFYKEACDNEAHVLRTTLSEALRESREDGSERSAFTTGRPRISAPSSLGSASSSPLTEVSLHSAAVVGGCGGLPPASASSSDHSDSGSNSGPVSSAPPPAKRHKVGFFNIFDPPSSSTVEVTGGAANAKYRSSSSNTPPAPVTIAAPVVVCQSQSINKDSVSLVATTEVISLQEAPTESQHIASAATGATSAVPTSSNRDDPVSDGADVMADIVADLACRVCGRLITNHPDPSGGYSGNGGGTNAMIECSLCHGLYHQLCHTPPVLGRLPATNLSAWTCSTCSSLTHQPELTPSVSEPPVVTAPLLPNPIAPNSSVSRRKRQSSAVVPSPRQQRN
ncbi:hypothetical protein AAHC03_025860 [Spirometra sp. Aus1]